MTVETSTAISPLRILVVDDEPLVREVMSVFLSGENFQLELAETGEEGIEKFQASPDAFDLVLTDRFLPGIHGDEVAAAVKALRPAVPVLLLSGCGEEDVPESLQASIDGVVGKPFTISALKAAMQRVCPRSAAAS